MLGEEAAALHDVVRAAAEDGSADNSRRLDEEGASLRTRLPFQRSRLRRSFIKPFFFTDREWRHGKVPGDEKRVESVGKSEK